MIKRSESSNYIARVIRKMTEGDCTLTLCAPGHFYPLPVDLVSVDVESSTLVVRATCNLETFERYLGEGVLSLDIEVHDDGRPGPCYIVDNLTFERLDGEENTWELRCQLESSLLITGRSGGVRVPFVVGMRADVALEVFDRDAIIRGNLVDLSAGGCRVHLPIGHCALFSVQQPLHGVVIEFPGGQTFRAAAKVCSLRGVGGLHAIAMGLSFIDLDASGEQMLLSYVAAAEMELSYRLGMNLRGARPSPLFQSRLQGRPQASTTSVWKPVTHRHNHSFQGVIATGHTLHVALISLKNHQPFPIDMVCEAAWKLLGLLREDRAGLLYALGCLRDESGWVREAIRVAARLGDTLLEDRYGDDIYDAMVGGLLHTMGKPLLQGVELPSLDGVLTERQRARLRGHVPVLLESLQAVDWQPGKATLDVIVNANERLDGSGYPAGKRGSELSRLARMVAVIKMVGKLIDCGFGQRPLSPLEAYRWLYQRPEVFDREYVAWFARRYGTFPIGCLVRFSKGHLGWVRKQNERGAPVQIHVVKNLAFPDTMLNTVLEEADMAQIGEPEVVVNPQDYNVPLPAPL